MPNLRRLFLSIAFILAFASAYAAPPNRAPQFVAYIFPGNSLLTPGQVDAGVVTRFNYAFANIQNGVMVAGYPKDTENFALLTSLRKQNPRLTVLVSVGGWLWSGNFSEMALTAASRARFIESAVDFVARYQLDGLDVDWEYPGMAGATQAFRPEDKQNFTALLSELRVALDREAHKSGRRLYLTIAAGASPDFLAHTEMDKVARIVDTVNLMSYDYYEPGSEPTTGHHAPLFTNPHDPEKVSADASVQAFEHAGVPAGKLVLGIPLYGRAWADVSATDHGLYQPGKPGPNASAPFSVIESSMLGHGFARTWDPVSKVPSLYNAETRTFVSYEDEQSIAAKCQYVGAHKLAGIMVWDVEDDDPSGTLVKAIHACMR